MPLVEALPTLPTACRRHLVPAAVRAAVSLAGVSPERSS
jgi:hypothetical protein